MAWISTAGARDTTERNEILDQDEDPTAFDDDDQAPGYRRHVSDVQLLHISNPDRAAGGGPDNDDDALLLLERELTEEGKEPDSRPDRVHQFYMFVGRLLVSLPHRYLPCSALLLLFILAHTGVVTWRSVLANPPQRMLDDISQDATKGFETRGTYISSAMRTGVRLFRAVEDVDSDLSLCPDVDAAEEPFRDIIPSAALPQTANLKANESRVAQVKMACAGNARKRRATTNIDPSEDEMQTYRGNSVMFVFEHRSGISMFNVDAIHSLCDVTEQQLLPSLRKASGLNTIGYIHLGTQILRANPELQHCKEIKQQHVDAFRANVHHCAAGLEDPGAPTTNSSQKWRTREMKSCPNETMYIYAAMFHVDVEFIRQADPQGPARYSTVWVTLENMGDYDNSLAMYYTNYVDGKSFGDTRVVVTGLRFSSSDPYENDNIKFEIFQNYILSDMVWFILALSLVFVIMVFYLLRPDLLLATLFSILSGYFLAYALYFAILDTDFFPFINVLGLLILIAVGPDDVFVLFDTFEQVRVAQPKWPLERVVAESLRHAVPSVFVTSATTASAFYANTVSSITTVRLFGVFAGTAVLVNFFVMILVVPSVIVLSEKLLSLRCCAVEQCRRKVVAHMGRLSKLVFSQDPGVPRRLLTKTWPVWILVLGGLGIAACIVVFVKPQFKLPVTSGIQLLQSDSLIENYNMNIKKKLMFELENVGEKNIVVYYIWGLQREDPGSHMNPNKEQDWPLHLDPNFDYYSEKTQQWLLDYCRKIKHSEFVPKYYQSYLCSFEAYEHVINRLCNESSMYIPYIKQYAPECCGAKKVPFPKEQLQTCGPLYEYLYKNPLVININIFGNTVPVHIDVTGDNVVIGYPLYKLSNDVNKTNTVVGYLFDIGTQRLGGYEYSTLADYHKEMGESFIEAIEKGPRTVRRGFCAYDDYMWFYDLQRALATGTYQSIGLSLAVALAVMLLTSLSAVITLYAMVTIALAIAATVAVLVLLGWHLGIIESTIISLAVGLSIDFTIHYGVAYRLSKADDSKSRTCESFERVGPAVAMAALTTFTTGACMMPCHVLVYTKLGVFLMLVMSAAWLYATFFFQSLCWIRGPRRRPNPFCCVQNKSEGSTKSPCRSLVSWVSASLRNISARKCCPPRRAEGLSIRADDEVWEVGVGRGGHNTTFRPLEETRGDDDSFLFAF